MCEDSLPAPVAYATKYVEEILKALSKATCLEQLYDL